MPTTTIVPVGQVVQMAPQTAVDSGGNPASITERSASIDNYPQAYVAVDGNKNIFAVLKATLTAGTSLTSNVTLGGKDTSGNDLPPIVQTITFSGPPVPPLAVQIVEGAVTVVPFSVFGTPSDPGTSSVTF